MLRIVVLAALLAAAPAAAQPPSSVESDGEAVVAVIPFQGEGRLGLYGQPVASEVARLLVADGIAVVVVSEDVPVPARARLAIHGTIAQTADRRITLEARIHDPARGQVAALRTSIASLMAIDKGAAELASLLVITLKPLLASPSPPVPVPVSPPASAVSVPAPVAPSPSLSPPPARSRPFPPSAIIATTRVSSRSSTAVATAIATRLGYRPILSPATTGLDPGLASRGSLVLVVEVLSVRTENLGVLVGRGRVYVRAFYGGKRLFDNVVRTDTLVGSRGDDVDTLTRLVIAQVVDIVVPRLRTRLTGVLR